MNTRDIFRKNLNRFIEQSGKSKKMISAEMNIPYTTLAEWANGNKFPRADGIEKLANYFKILKSDLLEEENKDKPAPISDDDIKFALFGEVADEIPDEKLQEVKNFVQFIKENYKKDK